MSDIVPRSELSRQGVRGVVATAGGIGALVLGGLFGWWGIILGGVITVVGIALSRSPKERTIGLVTAALGAVVLVSSILPQIPVLGGIFGVVRWLIRAAGIVLIGVGGFSLFKFISGLRKRT